MIRQHKWWVVSGLVLALLYFRSLGDPFFWDGVQLGAKHAWFFYESNFTTFWLPNDIDSGHPPFFGIYLAAWWRTFSPNLLVSHLAILPFIILFFIATAKIGQRYLGKDWGVYLLLLYLADPTILSQLLLIGPDVALLAFFLLAFLGYSQNRYLLQALGIVGLALISMRGMMCAFALFLFELGAYLQIREWEWKWWKQRVLIYAPGVLLAVGFLFAHYLEKGWIGHHAESPWAASFRKNDWLAMLKHGGILIWRLLDFGRIFLWITLTGLLLKNKNRSGNSRLVLLLLIVLSWPFLVFYGLNQHRYLAPVYLILSLVFLQQLKELEWSAFRQKVVLVLVMLGLASGNFWVYPDSIAQGWDSTLAHRPYFQLRTATVDFLISEQIPLEAVGTAFPAIGPLRNYNPAQNGSGFSNKDEKVYNYYFISNIMNGYTEAEQDLLRQSYQPIFEKRKSGIYVSIYEKKKTQSNRTE